MSVIGGLKRANFFSKNGSKPKLLFIAPVPVIVILEAEKPAEPILGAKFKGFLVLPSLSRRTEPIGYILVHP